MARDKHMIEALSDMLLENESLMYPVWGYFKDNGLHQFAYFGFTENHLLIAYLSGEHVIRTERIPLEIASVKINKSPILNEYTINIFFINKKSYIFYAPPKVLNIKAQKENFPLFLETLKRRAKSQAKSLKEIEGKNSLAVF